MLSAYNQKISPQTVLSIYKDFDPVAIRLLELANPDSLRVWKLMDLDDIPRWSVNRTVLLGDACHVVVPFGFSRAAMAFEDAVTLTVLLPSNVTLDQIENRLKLYETIRRPRVKRVREASRELATGKENVTFMLEYGEFLGSHDAVEYAKDKLAESSRARSAS
jgi:salicylate hydroxylase